MQNRCLLPTGALAPLLGVIRAGEEILNSPKYQSKNDLRSIHPSCWDATAPGASPRFNQRALALAVDFFARLWRVQSGSQQHVFLKASLKYISSVEPRLTEQTSRSFICFHGSMYVTENHYVGAQISQNRCTAFVKLVRLSWPLLRAF